MFLNLNNQPSIEFMALVVKLSTEREKKKNVKDNNKSGGVEEDNTTTTINNNQYSRLYKQRYLDSDELETTLSWLLYLVLRCDLPTIKKESAYLLDNALRKKMVDIYCSFICFLREQSTKDGMIEKENVLRIMESLDSFAKSGSDTIAFYEIMINILSDPSHHQNQLRAINTIAKAKLYKQNQNLHPILELLQFWNYSRQSNDPPTILFSHDTVVQVLIDRLEPDALSISTTSLVLSIDPIHYKYVSNRIIPLILNKFYQLDTEDARQFALVILVNVGKALGLKYFSKYLYQLVQHFIKTGSTIPCTEYFFNFVMDLDLDFDYYFSIYLPCIIKSVIARLKKETEEQQLHPPIDNSIMKFLNCMVKYLYPYFQHLIGPICKNLANFKGKLMYNILAITVAKEGFTQNSQYLFERFTTSLVSGSSSLSRKFKSKIYEMSRMIDFMQRGVWTNHQIQESIQAFIEWDNQYLEEWDNQQLGILEESLRDENVVTDDIAYRYSIQNPWKSMIDNHRALSEVIIRKCNNADQIDQILIQLPALEQTTQYYVVSIIGLKLQFLCDHQHDRVRLQKLIQHVKYSPLVPDLLMRLHGIRDDDVIIKQIKQQTHPYVYLVGSMDILFMVIESTVDLCFNCQMQWSLGSEISCYQIKADNELNYGIVHATVNIYLDYNSYPPLDFGSRVDVVRTLAMDTIPPLPPYEPYIGYFGLFLIGNLFYTTGNPNPGNKSISQEMMINASSSCDDCLASSFGYLENDLLRIYIRTSTLTYSIRYLEGNITSGTNSEFRLKLYPSFDMIGDPYDALSAFVNRTRQYKTGNETTQKEYDQSLTIYVNGQVVQANGTSYNVPDGKVAPPPSEFIDVIVKLAIAREKKKTNNKDAMITKIEEKGEQEVVLSWLLYLVVKCELSTIKKQSIYLLDKALRKYFSALTTTTVKCCWSYNQYIVESIFNVLISTNNNNNDNDDDDSESQTLLISILNTLNVGVTLNQHLDYLKLIENTIRNHLDNQVVREIILKIMESIDMKQCISKDWVETLEAENIFNNIMASFLTDHRNHQYQLRAFDIIESMKEIRHIVGGIYILELKHMKYYNKYEFCIAGPRFKFSNDQVIQHLLDRIELSVESGYPIDPYLENVISFIAPSKYKCVCVFDLKRFVYNNNNNNI
ncbi:hypothetical protein DFA_10679 [Cavenderia fasciculata]|uniref:Uncharacterized protein n=1 Tax=Cavenderia fasciculata TaxID=261658 RepID=F4QB34_CACFS|nr:uncharacterized protein DFA_10679 [Cavenderia fasciculata]EGG14806.1 hypothetical protein DFA_10679 [Cavenderia fasciculata]|eukprot:XP_004351322.1 hypothetical protein DFA_10679 [Cavenderia fasciculata]